MNEGNPEKIMRTVSVNNRAVPCVLYPGVIPIGRTETEIWELATAQASEATAAQDDGTGKYLLWPDSPDRTWVHRKWHRSGVVEIFKAGGESQDDQRGTIKGDGIR